MWKTIAMSVILILAGLSLLYLDQRRFLFVPAKRMPEKSAFHAEDMIVVQLKTADQLKLYAWYKPAKKNKPTILYLHGNAGHIGYRMPLARLFMNAGLGILLLEYRGYGGNPGSPSEKGLYLDAEAGLSFLKARGIKDQELVIIGESLGTGVASKIALDNPACALILQSPFRSIQDAAEAHYPWLKLMLWDQFDTASRIKAIHVPLFISHGQNDAVVPYQQGESLYREANEPKEFLSLKSQGHNLNWNADYANQLLQFIAKHCK